MDRHYQIRCLARRVNGISLSQDIRPAPPKEVLKKFGGPMTITAFRKHFNEVVTVEDVDDKVVREYTSDHARIIAEAHPASRNPSPAPLFLVKEAGETTKRKKYHKKSGKKKETKNHVVTPAMMAGEYSEPLKTVKKRDFSKLMEIASRLSVDVVSN